MDSPLLAVNHDGDDVLCIATIVDQLGPRNARLDLPSTQRCRSVPVETPHTRHYALSSARLTTCCPHIRCRGSIPPTAVTLATASPAHDHDHDPARVHSLQAGDALVLRQQAAAA